MLKICLNFRGSEILKRAEKGWFFHVIWQLKDHILICYCSFVVLNPARDSRVSQIWAIFCLKNWGSRIWKRTEFSILKLSIDTKYNIFWLKNLVNDFIFQMSVCLLSVVWRRDWHSNTKMHCEVGKSAVISKLEWFLTEWTRSNIVLALDRLDKICSIIDEKNIYWNSSVLSITTMNNALIHRAPSYRLSNIDLFAVFASSVSNCS